MAKILTQFKDRGGWTKKIEEQRIRRRKLMLRKKFRGGSSNKKTSKMINQVICDQISHLINHQTYFTSTFPISLFLYHYLLSVNINDGFKFMI